MAREGWNVRRQYRSGGEGGMDGADDMAAMIAFVEGEISGVRARMDGGGNAAQRAKLSRLGNILAFLRRAERELL